MKFRKMDNRDRTIAAFIFAGLVIVSIAVVGLLQ